MSIPVLCKNGSAETTVAECGQNSVVGLWGHTPGENWPPEPTSSYASIDFWCLSLLFNAGQAAIKLPSAEASKRAQCTSPGQYTPYIKGIMKTP